MTIFFLLFFFSLASSLPGTLPGKEELTSYKAKLLKPQNKEDDVFPHFNYFLTHFSALGRSTPLLKNKSSTILAQLINLCKHERRFEFPFACAFADTLLLEYEVLNEEQKMARLEKILDTLEADINKIIVAQVCNATRPLTSQPDTTSSLAPLFKDSLEQLRNNLTLEKVPKPLKKRSSWRHFTPSVDSVVSLVTLGIMTKYFYDAWKLSHQTRKAEKSNSTRFANIAGIDEILEEVKEVVDCLLHPQRYTWLGAKPPRGILLKGPPGVGKTLIARAIAHEAGCSFYALSGSEFIEAYVGVGAARIRNVFAQARAQAPAIIFIDEIDALGSKRLIDSNGGSKEYNTTLNQLLIEMDGFSNEDRVLVIGATNQANILDKALLRPGRFDRIISIHLPDQKARKSILMLYLNKLPHVDLAHIDISYFVTKTEGFSSAELEDLVNAAVFNALRRKSTTVEQHDMFKALHKALTRHTTIQEKSFSYI